MDEDVYLTAGRSIFLDGGITFYRLDLATGDVLVQKQMDHMSPEGENYHALGDRLPHGPLRVVPGTIAVFESLLNLKIHRVEGTLL